MTSGPGYAKHPEHRIALRPAGVRVQVRANGEVIADTRNAIVLEETGYRLVYYIPRRDVKMERLARSERRTYCPFKGQASYYSLAGGAENAVWSYEDPYDEVSPIKDHLGFYAHRVDAIEAGL